MQTMKESKAHKDFGGLRGDWSETKKGLKRRRKRENFTYSP